MIAESAKAWVAGAVTLLMAIGGYAVAQDWATWGLDQWRGLASAALDAILPAAAAAGAVWLIPNRKPAP